MQIEEILAYHKAIYEQSLINLEFAINTGERRIILATFSMINAINIENIDSELKEKGKELIKRGQNYLLGDNIRELKFYKKPKEDKQHETKQTT